MKKKVKKQRLEHKTVSLNKIATNMIVERIKPNVRVYFNEDGSQKVVLEYNVPESLIKDFDDWVQRMEHLVDPETGKKILVD